MDNYKQNKEIKKESNVYFSCCNKVLDYLYEIKDSIPADNNIILDFENKTIRVTKNVYYNIV